jgi:hypothetical protein
VHVCVDALGVKLSFPDRTERTEDIEVAFLGIAAEQDARYCALTSVLMSSSADGDSRLYQLGELPFGR